MKIEPLDYKLRPLRERIPGVGVVIKQKFRCILMGSVEMLPDRLAVTCTKECPRKGARPWITKAWVLGTLEGSVNSPPQTSGP